MVESFCRVVCSLVDSVPGEVSGTVQRPAGFCRHWFKLRLSCHDGCRHHAAATAWYLWSPLQV